VEEAITSLAKYHSMTPGELGWDGSGSFVLEITVFYFGFSDWELLTILLPFASPL
jgi:hypothetical protein